MLVIFVVVVRMSVGLGRSFKASFLKQTQSSKLLKGQADFIVAPLVHDGPEGLILFSSEREMACHPELS